MPPYQSSRTCCQTPESSSSSLTLGCVTHPALDPLWPFSREARSCGEGPGTAGDLVQILPSLQAHFNYPAVGTYCLQSLPWQHAAGGRDHPLPHFKFPATERKRREGQIVPAQRPACSAVLPQPPAPHRGCAIFTAPRKPRAVTCFGRSPWCAPRSPRKPATAFAHCR